MNTQITKLKNAVSQTALFTIGVMMLGLGFVFAGTLALFALVAVGFAMLAAPFVKLAQPAAADTAQPAA